MPKSRVILVFGLLVALLPALGFPRSWEVFFQVFAGLSIVVLSVWAAIDKKLTLKAKAQQRLTKKVVESPLNLPETVPPPPPPNFGKRVTDFYPRTAPPGRRLSDINPTLEPPKEEIPSE